MTEAEVQEVYEMVKTLADIAETGRVTVECKVAFFYDVLHAMEHLMDDAIVIVDTEGNEIATIDGDLADFVRTQGCTEYIHNALRHAIEEAGHG